MNATKSRRKLVKHYNEPCDLHGLMFSGTRFDKGW